MGDVAYDASVRFAFFGCLDVFDAYYTRTDYGFLPDDLNLPTLNRTRGESKI